MQTAAGEKAYDVHYYYNGKTKQIIYDDFKVKLPSNYYNTTPPNPNPSQNRPAQTGNSSSSQSN
jgi:hypothetical protein